MKLDKYKLITAGLVGITVCSGIMMASAYADTPASSSSSANASVTVSDTIRLTLTGGDLVINNLTPGTSADSNIITATVTSNSPYGYHLSATTGTKNGTTSLANTTDSNFSFTNLSANKATLNDFSDNTWGYSYSTDNGISWISGDYGTALAGYNGLSLDNDDSGATGTTLYNNDSYAGSTAVKFKIGAKSATTQAAGTYTGTVNFYAVTNPKPVITIENATTMQEVEACPETVPLETIYTLTDPRDNQTYKVARLKDGKCWMVENLNLAGGIALSSDDTDVTSAYIESFTTSNNLVKKGNFIVLPASAIKNSGDNDLTDTNQFKKYNYSYVFNSGNKNNCGVIGQGVPCYSYYSWDAITLGSGRTIDTDNTDAEQSICPKGWKLPSTYNGSGAAAEATDYTALMIGYGGSNSIRMYDSNSIPTGATMYSNIGPGTTPNFLLAGYYLNGSFDQGGNNGYYQSSTSRASASGDWFFAFDANIVRTALSWSDDRRYGFSVRCLFSGQQASKFSLFVSIPTFPKNIEKMSQLEQMNKTNLISVRKLGMIVSRYCKVQGWRLLIDLFMLAVLWSLGYLIERLRFGHGLQRIFFVNRRRNVIEINALLSWNSNQ